MIGPLILTLSIVYSAIFCHKNLSDQFSDARVSLLSSAVIWLLSQAYAVMDLPFSSMAEDLSLMVTYSVILVAILMVIRELKPEVFRYPYIAVFMPVIIPVSYYLVYQTSMIRETMTYSVSGMIMVVILFLTAGYFTKKKELISVIAGAIFLSASISISVFLDVEQYNHLLWYINTGTGIILIAYGFVSTFNKSIEI